MRLTDWLTARMPSAYRITINHRVLIEQRDHTVCSVCLHTLHTLNTHTQSEITAGLGEWARERVSFIHSLTLKGKRKGRVQGTKKKERRNEKREIDCSPIGCHCCCCCRWDRHCKLSVALLIELANYSARG